jgi:hypothetical protein
MFSLGLSRFLDSISRFVVVFGMGHLWDLPMGVCAGFLRVFVLPLFDSSDLPDPAQHLRPSGEQEGCGERVRRRRCTSTSRVWFEPGGWATMIFPWNSDRRDSKVGKSRLNHDRFSQNSDCPSDHISHFSRHRLRMPVWILIINPRINSFTIVAFSTFQLHSLIKYGELLKKTLKSQKSARRNINHRTTMWIQIVQTWNEIILNRSRLALIKHISDLKFSNSQ